MTRIQSNNRSMIVFMLLGVWFVSCSNPTTGRRYDVEMEAIKLFGEPLTAVIARLRRTPEYLDILTDRVEDLKKERDNYAIHLLEWYRLKLIEKVEKIYNVNSTEPSTAGLRSLNWPTESNTIRHVSLVLEGEGQQQRRSRSSAHFLRSRHHRRRQGVEHDQNLTNYLEEAVHRLDSHPILHHDLKVDERNKFKDMGFELAGEFIHSLISSMEPGDAPHPSTQQPWGDSDRNFNRTTKHSHVVTQPTTPITIYLNELNTTKGLMTPPSKFYKQRQKLFRN